MIPFSMPSMRYFPISAMTVDGLCIPNAFRKPFMNGSQMFFLIQTATFIMASRMPFRTPFQRLPPHSSAFFWKYFFASLIASPIKPPISAPRAPAAAPKPRTSSFTMPVQSIDTTKVLIDSPSFHQSVCSRNVEIVSRRPFARSPIRAPLPAQSKSAIVWFTPAARFFPKSDHLKVLADSPMVVKIAFHFCAYR